MGVMTQVISAPSAARVERAVKLTYALTMLQAIFAASTGGMFLIGYAIRLGAGDVALGLMATIPQYAVAAQFVAAALVERGISRRTLTILLSFVAPLGWVFIAAIPFLGDSVSSAIRLTILITVLALVTIFNQVAGNARSSWLGDLIHDSARGRFTGRCVMFAGLVGAFFAIVEGRFLDLVQGHGLLAFTGLFFFGAAFGLMAAALFVPQPDCPLAASEDGARVRIRDVFRDCLRNRPFVSLMVVHCVLALGGIAGPFSAAYLLRDVHVKFFNLGLINCVAIVTMVLTASLWGKAVDRFGCKPIIRMGLMITWPTALMWLFIPPGATARAYMLLPIANLFSGIGGAAINVGISTMIYKVTRPEGRSIQFAIYGTIITLVSAPMATLGGLLVTSLQRAGLHVDLRITFFAWMFFCLASALIAGRLNEPGSTRLRHVLRWRSAAVPPDPVTAAMAAEVEEVCPPGPSSAADGEVSAADGQISAADGEIATAPSELDGPSSRR